jgi:hypothetical protein
LLYRAGRRRILDCNAEDLDFTYGVSLKECPHYFPRFGDFSSRYCYGIHQLQTPDGGK